MELSRCRIRRTGCNALKNCFYCTVGLIWADGDCVFITPLQPPKNSAAPHQVHFCRHQVLGLFRTVHGLCYSSPKKWPPYISVVAERVDDGSLELSIWRMNAGVQCVSFSKWCVLSLPHLPVLQGCLWHPERDVFCVVFKESARIYAIRDDPSGSQQQDVVVEVKVITPFAGSRFVCGTWSKNGRRLILATESTLMFYNIPCSDIEQTEMEVILGLERVCCIESVEGERFVCTVELPLDSMVVRSRSERCLLEQSRGPLETLMSIHSATEGPLEGSSQLFLLQWNPDTDKPEVRSWDELYGILSPDLLAVEPSSGLIVVGSNSCHTLYVYGIADEQLEKLHDINLPKEERPKGVTIHNQEALLMIAKLPDEERQVLSLPRSEFVEYEVILQSVPLAPQSTPGGGHHHHHQNACTLHSLLGQAAKSSISLDSTISDPINRGRAASNASSTHMLNRSGGVSAAAAPFANDMGALLQDGGQPSTMTWPRGLLGDLKTHMQGGPLQRPTSAHANHPSSASLHHHHHAHPISATSEIHLAQAAAKGHQQDIPLIEDLSSLLHYREGDGGGGGSRSAADGHDMLDLSSLLSGVGLSSDILSRHMDDMVVDPTTGGATNASDAANYARKLSGLHDELLKKSSLPGGLDGPHRRRSLSQPAHAATGGAGASSSGQPGGSHTLPRDHHARSASAGETGATGNSSLAAVASRLVSLENSMTTLTRTQTRELQEIKNELSAIRRLLISVLFHVLPGEARSDAVSKYT